MYDTITCLLHTDVKNAHKASIYKYDYTGHTGLMVPICISHIYISVAVVTYRKSASMHNYNQNKLTIHYLKQVLIS